MRGVLTSVIYCIYLQTNQTFVVLRDEGYNLEGSNQHREREVARLDAQQEDTSDT